MTVIENKFNMQEYKGGGCKEQGHGQCKKEIRFREETEEGEGYGQGWGCRGRFIKSMGGSRWWCEKVQDHLEALDESGELVFAIAKANVTQDCEQE